MLFNSIEFLFFLPIVFLLYWFVFRSYRWQNLLIVLASYVFYGWWDWRFLLLIALTSFCSFLSGVGLERYEGHRSRQKLISAANIILNLSILGVFKYYNFFVESFSFLFSTMGLQLDWVTLNIVLPVGISFYTFQALSYTIDVYQHKLRATHDVVAFFAYISFFPQLVAGPIERATHLLPQFQKKRHFEYDKAVDGCRQMLWASSRRWSSPITAVVSSPRFGAAMVISPDSSCSVGPSCSPYKSIVTSQAIPILPLAVPVCLASI